MTLDARRCPWCHKKVTHKHSYFCTPECQRAWDDDCDARLEARQIEADERAYRDGPDEEEEP